MLAHVMGQRAAAARAIGHHDLDAHAGEEADRGLVDRRVQHLLGTAGEQGDAPATGADGGVAGGNFNRAGWRDRGGSEFQQSAQAVGQNALARQDTREGTGQFGALEGQAEQAGARQHGGEHGAQGPIVQGAGVGCFDIGSCMIDEVHVVHAGGAGGHAGQAGEAAVDMADHLLAGGAAGLQHVLDEVDAAARAVEFVAEQNEGRAGRGAETAMHAGSQDLVGDRCVGVAQLRVGKIGLHGAQRLRRGCRTARPDARAACASVRYDKEERAIATAPRPCGRN